MLKAIVEVILIRAFINAKLLMWILALEQQTRKNIVIIFASY